MTSAAAALPAPPGLLMTSTRSPSNLDALSAASLDIKSMEEPAGYGQTISMGLVGNSPPKAFRHKMLPPNITVKAKIHSFLNMGLPPFAIANSLGWFGRC
jgi:hypothetical protein